MARISETLNVGDKDNLTQADMLVLLEDMYSDLARAINQKPDVYVREDDGSTDEVRLGVGDININTSTLKAEILTSHVDVNTVTWTQIS